MRKITNAPVGIRLAKSGKLRIISTARSMTPKSLYLGPIIQVIKIKRIKQIKLELEACNIKDANLCRENTFMRLIKNDISSLVKAFQDSLDLKPKLLIVNTTISLKR